MAHAGVDIDRTAQVCLADLALDLTQRPGLLGSGRPVDDVRGSLGQGAQHAAPNVLVRPSRMVRPAKLEVVLDLVHVHELLQRRPDGAGVGLAGMVLAVLAAHEEA